MQSAVTDISKPQTLVACLRERAFGHPDHETYTFLTDGASSPIGLSNALLDAQARRIAARLQMYQAQGQRAVLLYPPGPEYIAAFFGCLYAGVVAVPAYPPLSQRLMPRLEAIVSDSEAAFVLTTQMLCGQLQGRGEDTPLARLCWIATDSLEGGEDDWRTPAISGTTLALLQYTSGSTAAPKGVMLTHDNVLHNLSMIQRAFNADATARGVFWLPFYHDMGLIGGILPNTILRRHQHVSFTNSVSTAPSVLARNNQPNSCDDQRRPELRLRTVYAQDHSRTARTARSEQLAGGVRRRGASTTRNTGSLRAYVCGERLQYEALLPCYGLAEATLLVSSAALVAPPATLALAPDALIQHRVAPAADTSTATVLVGSGRPAEGQRVVIVHPDTLHPYCARCGW